MDKFWAWINRNYTYIVWFIIGWAVHTGLDAISKDMYTDAILDFGVAYINYFLWSKR
jgi:hypothetical protein